MARRKAEIQLQMQIETQEEWEDLMSKEGLNVVDVYQEWCGPCNGMVSNFKKIKNEVGDSLLKFVTAKADSIDSLDKYRGHCEPCFLFYAGGSLVAVVRGANSPKILRTITEQLKQEHKVLDGNSERKEIKDPFIAQMEAKEKETDKEEEEEEEEGVKEVTLALIKPDAVQAGKVDQILEDIKAAGIEVLRHEERKMTEDEVRQFYSHLQDQDFFEELVAFMTSGPSHVLALTRGKTGDNIISEFRDLIGPTDVEEAKTQKPESLRAKHGQQTFMNALHGSSSQEMATRELAFFFPDFAAPTLEGKPKIQRTLALVRPEAFRLHKEEILSKIREAGFKVAMQKEMQLTKEMAEEFYKEHQGQEYFDQLVTNMSSGPVLALGLAREDAIEGWRNMLGPKEVDKAKEAAPESLRAQFAVDDAINSLHGSDSETAAKKEMDFFFPMEQTVAVIKPDAEGTKEEIIDRIHEAGFRIAARKETTLAREVAEEFYADHKDKEYYNDLVEHMTSGPTYLMVLSRESAVEGWRSIIGPTDPSKAKEEAPDSIRAAYGQDILKNAVHGSSTSEQAQKTIKAMFEPIDEEPEQEKGERPMSESTKEAAETAPEYKEDERKQEEEKPKEEQTQETQQAETKEEETKPDESEEQKQEQQPSEEQTTQEETKPDESEEQKQDNLTGEKSDVEIVEKKSDTQHDNQTEEISAVETVKEKSDTQQDIKTEEKSDVETVEKKSDTQQDKTNQESIDQKEQKEETQQGNQKEEETKAPSPKPDTEAQPSESEAKSEEQKEETKAEEQKSDESEQKAETQESTTQGEEDKKEETQAEEKAPETQTEEKTPETQESTEESKEEKKEEEKKPEGGD